MATNAFKSRLGNIGKKLSTASMKKPLLPSVSSGLSTQLLQTELQNEIEGTKATQIHREEIKKKIVSFLRWIYEQIWKFIDTFKMPLMHILKHLAKWIALLIVIIILFVGISKTGGDGSRRAAAYSQSSSTMQSIKDFFKSMRTTTKGITTPLGKKANNGMPRDVEANGRCDDIEWVSMEGTLDKKNVGLCFQSSIEKPSSIRWIIDPTNMYEYDTLPSAFKEKILSEPEKLIVTIPYKNQGSSYVLSCKDAVYEDGSSAKDLFAEETNTYCKLKTMDLEKSYKYTPQHRKIPSGNTYTRLDNYEKA
jgi:hypothetical protein